LIMNSPVRMSSSTNDFRGAETSAPQSTMHSCRVKSAGPQRAMSRQSRPSNNSTMMMITIKPNPPLGP
jgi:hypothetical protein